MPTTPNYSQPAIFSEVATPTAPDSGYLKVYANSGTLCSIANSGTAQSYLTSSSASGTYVPLTRTLNTLALSADQTFAVGTTGTDFTIASSVTAHTFNIPNASATARGLITTGTQTIAGQKTFTSSVLILGGQTNASSIDNSSSGLIIMAPANGAQSSGMAIGSAGTSVYSLHTGDTNSGTADCFFLSSGSPSSVITNKQGTSSVVSLTNGGLKLSSGSSVRWGASHAGRDALSASDLFISRDAAGTLAQRNSTNAQTFRLYNTYTSSTSFENLQFKSVAAAAYQIGSAIGSAGGTNRAITFGHWNTAGTFVGTAGITTAATTYGGRFSDDGGLGNGAEQFGANTTTCIEGLAVGAYATAGIQYGTAIGCHAYAGYFSTSLGRNAGTSGTSGGFPSANGFNYCITISDGTDNVAPTASSQFIVAGLWTEAYFGKKVTHATPLDVRFNATGGSGANIAGASFTLAGGKGTGTGVGGSLVFQTAPAGSAGSTLNSLVTRLTVDSTGLSTFAGPITLTQPVSTTGSPTAFTLTGAAHTTLTLSTEATDVNFNLSRTVQFATGALTTQRAVRIQAPTYGFVGASTITTASTLSISGPPVAGTNATITNAYALNVESGTSNFGGEIILNSNKLTFGSSSLGGNVGAALVWTSNYTVGFRVLGEGTGRLQFSDSGITLNDSNHIAWTSSNNSAGTKDLYLYRDAAATLAQRNSTNAQSFGVYGTWTSTSSYERINIRGKAGGSFEIGPENGDFGGTLRGLTIGGYIDGSATITPWLDFNNLGNATFAGTITASNLSGTNTGDQSLGDYLTIYDAGQTYLTQATFGYTTLNGIPISDNATFSVLNDGTDFTIESNANTHFFKMPDASDTARGLITTDTQTIAGAKTFSGPITLVGGSAKGIYFTSEPTGTPSGTTQTLTLADGNHQTLALTSATGTVTATLTVPTGSSSGTIIVKQHASAAKDIVWAVSSGTIKWMGAEPDWAADAVGSVRIVSWRYDGSVMYLASTEVAV